MKLIKTIIIGVCILIFVGCSKDTESYTQYPIPEWTITSPELLPNSFTAIVAIPDSINAHLSGEDMVAAFIDNECHGVGSLVESEAVVNRVYFITIRASDTENGEIKFRYYNSELSYLYQAKLTVLFTIDGTYGTYDTPIVLNLEQL